MYRINGLIALLFFCLSFLSAQTETSTYIDFRDGQQYEIIDISGTRWFRDNLRFETALSYCPNFSHQDTACINGNYYSFKELDNICPEYWRIPTAKEFDAYIKYRMEEQNGDTLSLRVDTLTRTNFSVNFIDTSETLNLLSDTNPLNLSEPGWVEGNKMAKSQTVSIWIRHPDIKDDKFHVHITNKNYILHTHEGYIDDLPEKSRKLRVKCVQ